MIMATTPPDLRRRSRRRRRSSANFTIIITLSFLLTILKTASAAQLNFAGKSQFREAHKFYNSPVCPDLRFEDSSADAPPLCSDAAIHVAMTLDSDYLRGSMAAIHSVLHHSACPENVFFHFIASSNSSLLISLRSLISSSFPYLRFRVYPFDDDSVSDLISTSIRPALDRPLNYARSYLASLLPDCVQRAVYLDSDVILVDDVSKLWSALPKEESEEQDQESGKSLSSSLVLAAPEYCNANFTSYFTAAFWSSPTLSLTFAGRHACYFNTGVMVINLRLWRKGDYTARIEEWMELQKRVRIYQLGSLPPFLLVFAGKIKPVDHRWNQHGLGGDNFRGLCRNLHPGPVSLLHWSGKGKPWVRLDANRPCPLDALWAPYDLFHTPFFLDS